MLGQGGGRCVGHGASCVSYVSRVLCVCWSPIILPCALHPKAHLAVFLIEMAEIVICGFPVVSVGLS